MEDEDEPPYIGNRGDALELLAQLAKDLGRVRPESGAPVPGKGAPGRQGVKGRPGAGNNSIRGRP
jgi:hypothetical protein